MATEIESEVVFEELPPVETGVYESVFTALEPFSYVDKVTNETEHRWRWVFATVDDERELDALTTPGFYTERGNPTQALNLFAGILGRPPKSGDKPASNYGRTVNVVYGPNKNGRLTITSVLPIKPKK